MLRVSRALNADRFLNTEKPRESNSSSPPVQAETAGDFSSSPRTITCYGRAWKYREIYAAVNTAAIIIHLACTIAIGVVDSTRLRKIDRDYVFVSPIARLDWTNHALVRADSNTTTCSEVASSPHYRATLPPLSSSPSAVPSLYPPRRPYPDFMHLFNFSNTAVIKYNRPGNEIHMNMMMMCFFLMSALFQSAHMYLLLKVDPTLPRFMHYLEYSISSPLMIMVMAVNVGLSELFAVTSLAALFCGMNLLGMCTEVMAHYAGRIDPISSSSSIAVGQDARPAAAATFSPYTLTYLIAHAGGWALFLFTMVPIWAQFNQVLRCSENSGTPGYAYAAIVLESILFFGFGFLQSAGLWEKYRWWRACDERHRKGDGNNDTAPPSKDLPEELLFRYDCLHAALSVIAKIFLAWLLLGPALSVDVDKLPARGV